MTPTTYGWHLLYLSLCLHPVPFQITFLCSKGLALYRPALPTLKGAFSVPTSTPTVSLAVLFFLYNFVVRARAPARPVPQTYPLLG